MNVSRILGIVDQIIPLLTTHGYPDKAEWLARKAALLRDTALPEGGAKAVLQELHRLVPGMGGLMDLEVTGSSRDEEVRVRQALDRLGDELYELTR